MKDCICDEQNSVARNAVGSTERLVKSVVKKLNLGRYIDRMSKRERSDPRLHE